MASRLKELDFRNATIKLMENEKLIAFFKIYGISFETLKTLMVGSDDEGNIICPIYNHRNVIQGQLTIKNIMQDGGIYIFDTYGLVGNAYSKDKKVTIAKNLIDVLLLWQMGVDSPVMVSDREVAPFIQNYKDITFVDKDDDLAEYLPGSKYTYGIKDLVSYCAMHKDLPKREKMDTAERQYEIEYSPFLLDNKLYLYTSRQGNVLNSDGDWIRSFKMSQYTRRIKVNDQYVVFSGAAWSIPINFKIEKKEEMSILFNDLFEMFYTHITFISEDQAKIMALFVLYQWTFGWKHPLKTHLHIINPSPLQVSVLNKVLKSVTPGVYGSSEAPSMMGRDNNQHIFFKHPQIYYDMCSHEWSYDIGPKVLITEDSADLRTLKIKRVTNDKAKEMRRRLANALFTQLYTPKEDKDDGLYSYYMPFYQVGLECGLHIQEIKRLFNVVCMSAQRAFKAMDKKDYIMNHSTKLEKDLE